MSHILTEPSSPATASSAVSSWPGRHASCRIGLASSSLPKCTLVEYIENQGEIDADTRRIVAEGLRVKSGRRNLQSQVLARRPRWERYPGAFKDVPEIGPDVSFLGADS